jgi:hypothetical protein
MAVDHRKLSACAERMKNQDPTLYEQFLRLLDAYTTELTVAVTEAPADQILTCQGRAQQARKFFQLMSQFPAQPSP